MRSEKLVTAVLVCVAGVLLFYPMLLIIASSLNQGEAP
jgi:ABC-type spermidine/putrescine transport system permease subunit II